MWGVGLGTPTWPAGDRQVLYQAALQCWPLFLRWIAQLHLPKFNISSEFNLKDVLPHLGIREVFTDLANFSGITEEKNIKISKVRLQNWGQAQPPLTFTAKADTCSGSPRFTPISNAACNPASRSGTPTNSGEFFWSSVPSGT